MGKPVCILDAKFLIGAPVVRYADVGNAIVFHALTVQRNEVVNKTGEITAYGYFSGLQLTVCSSQNAYMGISDERLEQFRELYRTRYGKEISKEQAYEQAEKLLCLLRRIYRPMTIERFEEIQKYRVGILPRILVKVASQNNTDMV